jgi:pimeloyl-ACP methyl ester carboxylesterase
MARTKPQRSLELALASLAAYPDARGSIHELELDTWHPFSEGVVEGFVGSTGKKVIVAFRGSTVTPGEYDTLTWLDKTFTDWSVNLGLNPAQYHSGRVQGSYLAAMRKAWPSITQLLNDHGAKDKNLWITGHSLGGALATLAGAMARWDNNLQVAGVYTFGSPKIADEAFAQNYPVPLFRYENRNDIFPHLPPSGHVIQLLRVLSSDIEEAFERWFGTDFLSWQPTPIGDLQYLDKKGRLVPEIDAGDRLLGLMKAMVLDPSQLLQDHWIETYCAALEATL